MNHTPKIKILTSSFLFFFKLLFVIIFMKWILLTLILIFDFSIELFISWIIFELCIITVMFVMWSTNYYIITDTVVIHRTGVFFIKEDDFNHRIIDTVSFTQTLLGRIFNYWTLKVNYWVKDYYLYNIQNPRYFTSILTESSPHWD